MRKINLGKGDCDIDTLLARRSRTNLASAVRRPKATAIMASHENRLH